MITGIVMKFWILPETLKSILILLKMLHLSLRPTIESIAEKTQVMIQQVMPSSGPTALMEICQELLIL